MEFKELCSKFFTQLLHNWEMNKNCHFDVTLDDGTQPIFWAKGYAVFREDEHGNLQCEQISISEAGFQWPDFEASLENQYINKLEKFCTE